MELVCPKCRTSFSLPTPTEASTSLIHVVAPGSIILCPECGHTFANPQRITAETGGCSMAPKLTREIGIILLIVAFFSLLFAFLTSLVR